MRLRHSSLRFALSFFLTSALMHGQAAPAISVDEAGMRARLSPEKIEVQLPIKSQSPATPARLKLTLLTWKDRVVGTSDTELALEPGKSIHSVSLNVKVGEPTGEIRWWRLRYELEVKGNPKVAGIVSLGGINEGDFDLRVARSRWIVRGNSYVVRVWTANPITRRAVSSVRVEGRLTFEPDEGEPLTVHVSKTTGRDGAALLEFKVPDGPDVEDADLELRATLGVYERTVDDTVDVTSKRRWMLQTDKPIYQPGQTVHMRVLGVDPAGAKVEGKRVEVSIKDREDEEVYKRAATLNEYDIAGFDWDIPASLKLGDYQIQAEVDGASPRHDPPAWAAIKISRYDLPNLAVRAELDRKFYLRGQSPQVTISADYLFGKPVKSGDVRVVRESERRWNHAEQKYDVSEEQEVKGKLTADGKFVLHPDVSKDLEELAGREYSRFEDIRFAAYVTDASTGRTEQKRFEVRLSRDPIHVYTQGLLSRDGRVSFYVNTSSPDGTAAPSEVTIYDLEKDPREAEPRPEKVATVTTNAYGVAKVELTLPRFDDDDRDGPYELRLMVKDRKGNVVQHDESFYDSDRALGRISTEKTLLRNGEPIYVTLADVGDVRSVNLDVVCDGAVLATQRARVRRGKASFIVPYDPRMRGAVSLVAYSFESRDYQAASRSVMYPRDRELKVALDVGRSYRPGEEVTLSAAVSGNALATRRSALGFAVIDKAVSERARTELEFQTWYGRYWWDWNQWYQGSSVAGITQRDLERLRMDQPLREGLDLVAEIILSNEWSDSLELREFDEDTEGRRKALESLTTQIDMLYKAMSAHGFPSRVPPDVQGMVRQFARQYGLPDSMLLDPWGVEFRFSIWMQGENLVLTSQSAGPDKIFDTADDFPLPQVTQPSFQPIARRIREVMEREVRESRPVHGFSELKGVMRAAGLDLDNTLDPWGQPYTFKFAIEGRYYVVRAERKFGTTGTEVNLVPVSRIAVDYFQPHYALIDTALYNRSRESGFPTSSADWEPVLTRAGLRPEEWVDAYRNPYYEKFGEREQYQDRVTVRSFAENGTLSQSRVTPVTVKMRTVEVRSAGPDGIPGNQDDFTLATFTQTINEQSGADRVAKALSGTVMTLGTGAVSGTVLDPSGAVVANAKVVLVGPDGAPRTATTESNGKYLLRELPAGHYTLRVSASGFKDFVLTDVPVASASLTTADVALRVSAATETVEVTAGSEMLSTTSSMVSTTVKRMNGTSAASQAARVQMQNFTPRLREYFPETVYWNPFVETDRNGRAIVKFKLADNITTWQISALASTKDGRIGEAQREIVAFQPFFVEHDPPRILTQGDEISLPVVLRNFTEKLQKFDVDIAPAPWFQVNGPMRRSTTAPAGDFSKLSFRFRTTASVTDGKQRISAANSETGDSVEKPVTVHPDGEEQSAEAGVVGEAPKVRLLVPAGVVAGSLHAHVKVFPNLMAHVIESVEGGLRRPYGCGEQTISSTYPSLMVVQHYAQAGGKASASWARAKKYLQEGYERLLRYQDPQGGFGYWNNQGPGDAALTAYAIEFLTQAQPFVGGDEKVLQRAQAWLLRQQKADGSWSGYGSSAVHTAYIARTLSQGGVSAEVRPGVEKAVAYLSTSATLASDPQLLTDLLQLQRALEQKNKAEATALQLRALARQSEGETRWELRSNTAFYGWGRAGEIETTARALSALLQHACGETPGPECSIATTPEFLGGLNFLLRNKDRYGVWYSGRATREVLRVLLAFQHIYPPESDKPGSFTVLLNGKVVSTLLQPPDQPTDAPLRVELGHDSGLQSGENMLEVRRAGGGSGLLSMQAVAEYYVPWDAAKSEEQRLATSEAGAMRLQVAFDRLRAKVGESITCTVTAERIGSRGYGMMLGEVGLPPGVDVDRASLEQAMQNAGWSLYRYDVLPDRLVVYLWPSAGGTTFQFRFKSRFGLKALSAASSLYDYYNPDAHAVQAPQLFVITD